MAQQGDQSSKVTCWSEQFADQAQSGPKKRGEAHARFASSKEQVYQSRDSLDATGLFVTLSFWAWTVAAFLAGGTAKAAALATFTTWATEATTFTAGAAHAFATLATAHASAHHFAQLLSGGLDFLQRHLAVAVGVHAAEATVDFLAAEGVEFFLGD